MATRGLGPGDITHNGKAIYLPPEVAHRISLRAAEIVRRTAPRGVHNSRMKVRATWQKGKIGVYFPPDTMHLVYLDKGIKPFVMKNLEGKTIPIRNPNGSISFRVAKNVGRRQILTRDEKGQITSSKIRWRYPGVEPMNFVQPAIDQAIREWVISLSNKEVIDLMKNTQGPIGEFFARFRKLPKVGKR